MGLLWRQLLRRWRRALPLGMVLLALLVVLLLKGCGGGDGVQSLLPTAQSPNQSPNPSSQPIAANPPATTPIGPTPGIPSPPPTLTPTGFPGTTAPESSTPTVTPTGFPGTTAPESSTPTLTPNTPGEPSGTPNLPSTSSPAGPTQILNAAEIDGIPLTIGQSLTLQGSSAATEWRDSTGRVLGQGPSWFTQPSGW